MFPKKVSFKDIDERKDKIFKQLLSDQCLNRDEKALKKRAAKEVTILNKEIFNKKKKTDNNVKTANIFDEFLHFIVSNK